MRSTLLVCLAVCPALAGVADSVRIGVFGLFDLRVVEVRAADARLLALVGCGERLKLEGRQQATVRAASGRLIVSAGQSESECASVKSEGSAELELSIPGKIRRRFRGAVEITSGREALQVVVEMRREDALAAIVASEAGPDWPAAALEAQAIVSRSYLRARGRHETFDFCDSTHCQYLADLPEPDGAVMGALRATASTILTHAGQPLEALFTRSCSGRTLTASRAGLQEQGYRYQAVECPSCSRRATKWTRRFPRSRGAELAAVGGEPGRIAFVRKHGWAALPSNSFEVRAEGDEIVVEGAGEGHGVGLCQRGAAEMARRGADRHTILQHFFPNASAE